jgi:hypothetical protein
MYKQVDKSSVVDVDKFTITNEGSYLLLLATLVAHSAHDAIPTIFDTIFRRVEPHREREIGKELSRFV